MKDTENDFLLDCESLCFDCGKPNPEHRVDEGVALCSDCYKEENDNARPNL